MSAEAKPPPRSPHGLPLPSHALYLSSLGILRLVKQSSVVGRLDSVRFLSKFKKQSFATFSEIPRICLVKMD